MCGGNICTRSYIDLVRGLSPRVRGKPTAVWPGAKFSLVYPRVCGGNPAAPPAARHA